MGVQNFTDGMIRRLPDAVDAKGYTVRDNVTKGLLIKVGMSKRMFRLQRKLGPVTKSFPLGEFPHVKVAEARKKAEDIIGRKARGENLVGTVGGKASIGEVATEWIRLLEREGRSPRTLETYGSVIKNLPPEWHAKPLRSLGEHPEELADLHDLITAKRGPKVANLSARVLSALYNWKRGKNPSANLPPVKVTCSVTRHQELPQERSMPFSEFSKWAAQVDMIGQSHPTYAAFYRLMLLTGSRPRALRLLTWADVDLERHLIFFAEAKGRSNRKGYTVPTSPEMEEQLKIAKASATVPSRFVFPRGHADEPIPENIYPARKVLSYRGGELRHAFKTAAHDVGVSNEISELLSGRGVGGTAASYLNRRMLAREGTAMREAQNKISRRMVELMAAPEVVDYKAAALVPA